MASLSHDKNGCIRLLFTGLDKRRKAIRLGRVDESTARLWRQHVEHILQATRRGTPFSPATWEWLTLLDDRMHGRLAQTELVTPRADVTVGGWLERFISERVLELKPTSIRKYQQTADKLNDYFQSTRELRSITPDDASSWRRWLFERGLSKATIRTHCGSQPFNHYGTNRRSKHRGQVRLFTPIF